jgi:hypothetical protein
MGNELFIRKSDEVEAKKYLGFTDSKNEIIEWLNAGLVFPIATYDVFTRCVKVGTGRGILHATPGDWIVKEPLGSVYVYSEFIFQQAFGHQPKHVVNIDPSYLARRSTREILEFVD